MACAMMLAGCAGSREDCPRWHGGGRAFDRETTLNQWMRMSAEEQLAAAALATREVFEFSDEHAWIAAAASAQECVNDIAYARDDGTALAAIAVVVCALDVESRRGMRRRAEYELGPNPPP